MQSKPAGAATLRRIRNHLRARRLRALLPDLFRLYWDAPEGSDPEDLAYRLASAIGASFMDFCNTAPRYAELLPRHTIRPHDASLQWPDRRFAGAFPMP